MQTVANRLPISVRNLLPPGVQAVMDALDERDLLSLEEIRLRLGRPLELVGIKDHPPFMIAQDHLRHVLAMVTGSSLYAVDQELRRGYITVQGGHRVGIAGRAVLDEGGYVKTLRDIGSLSIRIARQVIGCGKPLAQYMVDERKGLLPTLFIGPPLSGKTTLLRDVARLIGDGHFHSRLDRLRVSIVDERSEIAGCLKGVPQFDVGLATDVLDACPKVQGMYMMLRAMAPQVLATDEIGSSEDVHAIMDVARAGVTLIGTLHAFDVEDLSRRQNIQALLASEAIERFVFLSRRNGPATIERVYDRHLREVAKSWR